MNRAVYIETYGCQMNVGDSEVVLSLLQQAGYSLCRQMEMASRVSSSALCRVSNDVAFIVGSKS